jgi:hypothetical protein
MTPNRCANCGQPYAEHRQPLAPMGDLVWCPGPVIRTYRPPEDNSSHDQQ